jgi:hypothetical protein
MADTRWSELFHDPERLELELSKVGTTPTELAMDVRDVPELRERWERLSERARLLLALQWFGDEEHPQPPRSERTVWHIYGYTPDWGQLPPLDEGPLEHAAQPAPMSARGRRTKRVSVYEANVAARIYVQDRASYDAREDGGAYAVHTLYIEDREPSSALLSRPMVGHLLHAIREGWLPWDARKKRLRILNEFRTSNSMLVIPRSKPAS